ncbi:phenylalanyl-tRNA synthetase subunit alpha [Pedobacter frigidisoli]|nr:phenylalanyl-tRNA synthetase subunit alpha [Pedobacter frigidisoli]
MSKEILEFSVQVDEKFDLKFNWSDSFWEAAFKFFGK